MDRDPNRSRQALYHADPSAASWSVTGLSVAHRALLMTRNGSNRIKRDVTESRRLKEFSQDIVQNMAEGVAMQDAEGHLTFVNPAMAAMLGYAPEELLGQHWTTIVPPNQHSVVGAAEKRRAPGKADRHKLELVRKDGTRIPTQVSDHPWFEEGCFVGTLSVFTDISERVRAQKALEQRAAEFTLLNAASQFMVSSLDRETVMEATMRLAIEVLRLEAASVLLRDPDTGELVFEAAYGGGAEGLKGRRLPPGQGIAGWVAQHGTSLVVPDVPADERFYSQFDAESGFITRSILCVPLALKSEIIGVMQALNKIGDEFGADDQRLLEALASTAAIAIENARLHETVQRELGERMRAEQALKEERAELARRVAERTAELSAANAELARAARLKDEFLAAMSHELRTPLSAVLGLSEALQEEVYGPLAEKQLKPLRRIEEAGHHLLELINDVLDVAKIGAGKLELEIRPVSVEPICHICLRLVKQMAQEKRLKVSSTFDSQVTTIQADGRRLKQILVNLLNNAVKFTPEGGAIGLEVERDAEREAVRFTVWDTGTGISKEEMGRLFQPFVQVDSGLSRRHGGTGLGLVLVRRLTELHGGGISVASEVRKGSRFTVLLPWRGSVADPRLRLEAQPKGLKVESLTAPDLQPVACQLSGLRLSNVQPLVLLAEDDVSNMDTILRYLGAKGYRVIVARNGVEAIERAREERPGVILMDIQMPGMDGLEATRRIRADAELAMIPVIALTALAMPGDRERCLEAGANEYMAKPVALRELVRVIEAQLRCEGSESPAPRDGRARLGLTARGQDDHA